MTDIPFTLLCNDVFHSIHVSAPIYYAQDPAHESRLAFFVIKREVGKYDIVNILKTFKDDECISRNVQTKAGIAEEDIEHEIDLAINEFSSQIKAVTGYSLVWDQLDLSDTIDKTDQIEAIKKWGKLGLFCYETKSLN